jgi:Flp pilus assembly protein TadG
MSIRRTEKGQALVEFVLSITFISLLVAAVIDIGLAYKSHQMLTNAVAEASSYLSQQPLVPCGKTCTWTTTQEIAEANRRATQRFRDETGASDVPTTGTTSLRDLDSDGSDGEHVAPKSGSWLAFDVADSRQFNADDPGSFNINTFDPNAAHQHCKERRSVYKDTAGTVLGQCFVVVRAQLAHKPYFGFVKILGMKSTIRVYAIKPIVGTHY